MNLAPNGKLSNLSDDDYNFINSKKGQDKLESWKYKAAFEFAIKGEKVACLTGEEFQKAEGTSIVDNVLSYYKSAYDNQIQNRELGIVILDKEGIKDSLAHGIGKEKAAAYAAVPQVIKKGFVYERQTNWKNRGYDTAVIIAPVEFNGENYIEEVVVRQRPNKNKFYLHEIEIKNKLQEMFKTVTKDSIPQSSRLILARHINEVKNCSIQLDENLEPRKEIIDRVRSGETLEKLLSSTKSHEINSGTAGKERIMGNEMKKMELQQFGKDVENFNFDESEINDPVEIEKHYKEFNNLIEKEKQLNCIGFIEDSKNYAFNSEKYSKPNIQSYINNQRLIGVITRGNGEDESIYTDKESYLNAIKEGLDYGEKFSRRTVTNDPEVHKKIDDMIYGQSGLENPHSLQFYEEMFHDNFYQINDKGQDNHTDEFNESHEINSGAAGKEQIMGNEMKKNEKPAAEIKAAEAAEVKVARATEPAKKEERKPAPTWLKNAAYFKDHVKDGNVPFLKGAEKDGNVIIRTDQVRSATNGYPLTGLNQMLAQMKLNEMGSSDRMIAAQYAGKDGKPVYDVKPGAKKISLSRWDAASQTMKEFDYYAKSDIVNQDKLPPLPGIRKDYRNSNLMVECNESEPAKYIGAYNYAQSIGAQFKTTAANRDAVKTALSTKLEKDFSEHNFTSAFEVMRSADDIAKTTAIKQHEQNREKKIERSQSMSHDDGVSM